MRPTPTTPPLSPKVPAETEPGAMIREGTRHLPVRILCGREWICEWTPSRGAHLGGRDLRSIQEMPRQGWMTHKPLACQEASICRRAASILHHRMLRTGDSRSGLLKSASHPSAIYAVLDAIQQCFHLMCARGSVEQGNWDLSPQRTVWRRQPVRCLIPITQNVDRLCQCPRSSDNHVRLLRRQPRWRSICLGISRLLPIRRVT
jgi:hypothetical protein